MYTLLNRLTKCPMGKQKRVETATATATFCTDCIQRRINIAVVRPTHDVRTHRRKLP